MLWFILAILSAFFLATVSIIDKHILTRYIREPMIPVIIMGLIGLLSAIAIYIYYGFSSMSYLNITLSFIAGIFYIITTVVYFKVLNVDEVSRVVPLFFISPLFVLILAIIFLGETLTIENYIGIILLVAGAVLISSKKTFRIKLDKSFWMMMVAVLFVALGTLLTDYLLNFADYWTIFSYGKIGSFIAIIPLFYLYYDKFHKTIKRGGKRVVSLLVANEGLAILSLLLSTMALSVGLASLVSAAMSVDPFFILMYAIVLSIFFPKIIKEEISKSIIAHKLLAIIMIFIGGYLIL